MCKWKSQKEDKVDCFTVYESHHPSVETYDFLNVQHIQISKVPNFRMGQDGILTLWVV